MRYNWQLTGWPVFEFDQQVIDSLVLEFAMEIGELRGILSTLPDSTRQATLLQLMIDEAIKTSAIEGEFYSRQDIMSSIKNKIGLYPALEQIKDKQARGVGELMVTVHKDYNAELTEVLLQEWHEILFQKSSTIRAGQYRVGSEPMVIVSGSYGRETVHYQAPPSHQVPHEMQRFVEWYRAYKVATTDIKTALIKTAIAHLYFESIHPFEDGNGRVGRALAEKCLAECLDYPLVMSLSNALEKNKKEYYAQLKQAQSTLVISEWIYFFTKTILEAQQLTKQIIHFTLNKSRFLDLHRSSLNERQLKVIIKMLDQGTSGFEGGMTAKKYMSITKTSKATATRDLQDLMNKEVMTVSGAGRSVAYALNL